MHDLRANAWAVAPVLVVALVPCLPCGKKAPELRPPNPGGGDSSTAADNAGRRCVADKSTNGTQHRCQQEGPFSGQAVLVAAPRSAGSA